MMKTKKNLLKGYVQKYLPKMKIVKKRKEDVDVEIILLTYNNISNTKKFLDLLYKNTSVSFGLCIVENGSTDGTKEYLTTLSVTQNNITLILNEENIGIIKGRNLGYNVFKSLTNKPEYVCFLDNDQFVKKSWIDNYFNIFKKGYDIIGKEAWVMKPCPDFYPYKKITDPLSSFSYVGGGGLMFNRKVYQNINELFDEQYSPIFFEDPSFCFDIYYNTDYKIGWNSCDDIIHKSHNLLGGKDRVFYFRRNLCRFREKWKDKEVPIFKMDK